ncbi:MAG: orotate phosphoribosyltransferase [Paludibacteraceae bacterium]|nr:orotate phosphoribosyltransferase [Paludibacteraceae bacterium]
MNQTENKIAEYLIKVKAIKLQPKNPFTWASGWKSPIYCDNRKTLSYPEIRTYIKDQLVSLVKEKYPDAEVIAGIATGAISQGVLVAEELGLPFIYVRSKPKDHGLENMIEGDLRPHQKVVVIEDLVSTGQSSLNAVDAIRKDGSTVLGMLAIFSYQLRIAQERMSAADVELTTLCNYDAIIRHAVATKYITESEAETLQEWRKSPETWLQ